VPAIAFIQATLDAGHRVLVHCFNGQSACPTLSRRLIPFTPASLPQAGARRSSPRI
jgi:hypothetical protein